MERLTDKNHNAVNRCGEYSSCYSCNKEKCYISKLADKLGEFEDFMEEHGFESLGDLKSKLNKKFYIYNDDARQGKVFNGVFFSYEQLMVMDEWAEFNTDYFKKYLDSQKENQALKTRWGKFWDWIYDKKPISKGANAIFKKSEILDKMCELELAELLKRKEM